MDSNETLSTTFELPLEETPSLVALAPADRSFAELNREVWYVIRRAPWATVLCPALLLYPADWLTEVIVAAKANRDWFSDAMTYMTIFGTLSLLICSMTYGATLAAIKRLANGQEPKLGQCYIDASETYGGILSTWFLANIRTNLGFLVGIVPGVVMFVRYALIAPAVVLGDLRRTSALKQSSDLVRGRWWRTLGKISLAVLCYAPWLHLPMFLISESAPAWQLALTSIPLSIGTHALIVGLGVLYIDRATGTHPLAASADHQAGPYSHLQPRPASRKPIVALGLCGWFVLVGGFFGMQFYAGHLLMRGDQAYYAGEYEAAHRDFTRVIELYPDDPYAHYSAAATLLELDRSDEALDHVDRALAIEPQAPTVLFLKIQILFDLDRMQEARAALASLKLSPYLDDFELAPYISDIEGALVMAGPVEG